jgi:hypothetical protein
MRVAILPMAAFILVLAGCGSSHTGLPHGVPKNRLIVPGVSMGEVRFGEPRREVERAVGPGHRIRRDYFSYLNGRLRINYSFHDEYTGRAQALITTWAGFRTRSGVHVGSTRQALQGLKLNCFDGECSSQQNPDNPGILFGLHRGRVVWIYVGAS